MSQASQASRVVAGSEVGGGEQQQLQAWYFSARRFRASMPEKSQISVLWKWSSTT